MSKWFVFLLSFLFVSSQIPARAQDAQRPLPDANRAVVMAPTDLGSVIDRLAGRSGEFKDEFDKEIGHSMEGKHIEERAKHRADDLHDQAKKLKDVFGDKKDKNAPQVREQVDRVLATVSELSRVMAEHRFTDKMRQDWNLMKGDLNGLAGVYGLSTIE